MPGSHLQTWIGPEVTFGPFRLYLEQRVLLRADTPLRLGSRAREILLALIERPGEIIRKRELMNRVWPDTVVEEGALRVHISAIRKALGDGRAGVRYIENVNGHGYRFIAPVTRVRGGLDVAANDSSVRSGRSAVLPARLPRMVGRDQAVADISRQLVRDRFVTVVGPGGIGKTTVAVSVAHAISRQFAGEIVFVDLGSIADPTLVASTLASALGLAVPDNDPVPALLAFVHVRRVLLVLDSCEHVVDVIAPVVGRIFGAAPQVFILATSREPLHVEGEHVHVLAPLGSPSEGSALSAVGALTYPAVQLFMERAAAGGSRFELTDETAPIVGAVCRRLDGIALAVELAASRVNALGIDGIAELLDMRHSIWWQARRALQPRHQTLEALLDWSYNLLSPAEQLVLRRLSIFVGPFTLQAAQAVVSELENDSDEVITILANLVEKSLVSAASLDTPAQYRLLETTRAYASVKLAQIGETDAIARRHAQHFARVFRSWDHRPQISLTAATQNLCNVRAALEWCFAPGGNTDVGTDLILAATPALLRVAPLTECRGWSERALATLRDDARGTTRELDLVESLAIATMFTRGNDEDARVAILRGLDLARMLGDSQREMDLLAGLNLFATRTGDFQGALEAAGTTEALARKAGDRSRSVAAEWMLGVANHLIGDQALAQKHCDEGFTREASLGHRPRNMCGYDHRIRALVALARTLWLRGFAQQAARVAGQAIGEAELLHQPVSMCISLIYTAPVFLWNGDLDSAASVISRLLEHAREHSLSPYHAVGRGLLGELMLARGRHDVGVEMLLDALQTLERGQHRIQLPEFFTHLAEALSAQGRNDYALACIERAIAERARSGASFDMPEILRVKGTILLASPGVDRILAEDEFAQSFELALDQSSLAWALRTAMASVRAVPDSQQSRQMLADVYGRFTEGFDTPDLQGAQRLLGVTTRHTS